MVIGNGRADLHTHSTASDGLHKPAQVVRLAKEAGLTAVALTDHDTIAGVDEALEEGRRSGILVVPGVELSTVANGKDIHILGYCTLNNDSIWRNRLESLGNARTRRNEMILSKLQDLGIPVTMREVLDLASGSGTGDPNISIGRPHIAAVLISRGVVASMEEAFLLYLASGAAAYAQVPKVHPSEAINWIREAGGVSVIAHPGLYGDDKLMEELILAGVDGIEVFHSDHGPIEVERYSRLAERYDLIQTGGSDFHGERAGASYHGPIGGVSVDAAVALQLQALGGRPHE